MKRVDPILLFVASQVAPMSLRVYIEKASLSLRENTVLSVMHLRRAS